jgi:Ni/Co efflux regulator RcnB
MKRKAVVSVITVMLLTVGEYSFAESRGMDRNDRGDNDQSQRVGQQGRRGSEGRGPDRREMRRRDHRDDRRDEFRDARGAGPNHDFHRGGRLPMEYRDRYYVVEDWRGHHLSAPPRGYHWVQTGADYVLVAVATGVILQILLGN